MSEDRYLVTARKYRPRRFRDLVAQQHVSDTLRNALVQDRLAHAYLFSGPRGVGKTTAARILGQAINCTTPLDDRDRGEPCGECEACASFQEGRSLNIIEIDAASNNKVDDVRALREKVRIPPQGGKKKVYIIDEVHMLSNQAFNALLKTLEEPPDHVLFIFATTEPNKVLPTILSRCQRFDFRRIAVSEIMDRLRYVCEREEVDYDEESLMLIAKRGNGALRDALSVFDQAVALCGTTLRHDDLAEALGVVELDLFFEVTERITEGDTAGMIRLVERIVRSGHDLQEFLQGLSEHLRNLMVTRSTGSTELVQASEANRTRYREVSATIEEADLLRLLMIASDAASEVKSNPQPRLQVEMALLEMAHLNRTADLQRVLDRLEGTGDGNLVPSETGERSESGVSGEAPDTGDPTGERTFEETAETDSSASPAEEDASSNSPSAEAASSSTPGESVLGPPALKDDRTESSGSSPTVSAAGSTESEAPTSRSSASQESPPSSFSARADTVVAEPPASQHDPDTETGPAPDAGADRESEPDAHPDPTRRSRSGDESVDPDRLRNEVRDGWTGFLRSVKRERVSLGTCLQHTRPGAVEPDAFEIRVPDNFHRQTLEEASTFLRRELQDVTDEPVPPLRFTVDADLDDEDEEEPSASEDPFEHVKKMRKDDPVVRAIFDQFGGDFVY